MDLPLKKTFMPEKKPIIIANWKMKLGIGESKKLALELKHGIFGKKEVVICPAFVSLVEVAQILKNNHLKLGAQDCFWEVEGAFTGEVSARHLAEIGCQYVILGHSERRQHLGETDEMVHQKVRMALSVGLTPIICVGETFEQRQEGAKDYILIQQTTKALQGAVVKQNQKVIIAYEPVWVIGSGQAVSPAEASGAHQVIWQTLFDFFPSELVKNNFSVIYGGSVDSENVSKFTGLDNCAGVLVGSASLVAKEFIEIVKNS
ncbi:MAG: triose-phosphate isomerase [Candidatus Buchananbacteria bacterium RIFCSPHIGHO2_01_FULL_39_14]|uniref:Triosephosphate isomerase n=2 Tax=Candidatus Buchananiibacteriota TaxID=1817903 RepID=A0A1G1YRY7_9BACT|nr:MAG: triose-phosphate isomerase [Candidatus Buchananbacteria bacterium RIFCSPHIGHO2_01_FULL_39_14]OGY49306.1 MAG: triose-phosphate isomerase [Candidatus Buchananbacteria bacterium RIFCSPHIGHO2_02_FULL_39_17]OGY55115.1 MAG: triose-phosphate isomerase [Candidatus Buchananbacteria bacterium RIFCSPLOWO2_01_FULL_40_23b]